MTGIIVDGVAYTAAQIRRFIHDRHMLATELAETRETLRLRTAALSRVVHENETLRETCKPL